VGLDPYNQKLNRNSDGSVDVYFGPNPSQGQETNWVYTALGKKWFTNAQTLRVPVSRSLRKDGDYRTLNTFLGVRMAEGWNLWIGHGVSRFKEPGGCGIGKGAYQGYCQRATTTQACPGKEDAG